MKLKIDILYGHPNSPLPTWCALGLRSTVCWCSKNNFLFFIPSLNLLKFHSNARVPPTLTENQLKLYVHTNKINYCCHVFEFLLNQISVQPLFCLHDLVMSMDAIIYHLLTVAQIISVQSHLPLNNASLIRAGWSSTANIFTEIEGKSIVSN